MYKSVYKSAIFAVFIGLILMLLMMDPVDALSANATDEQLRIMNELEGSDMTIGEYMQKVWPEFYAELDDEQKEKIRTLAREILDTRDKYPDSCLADLYDTIAMPTDLLKAHQSLDKEVVKLYGEEWKTESDIISGLFRLYVQKTSS